MVVDGSSPNAGNVNGLGGGSGSGPGGGGVNGPGGGYGSGPGGGGVNGPGGDGSECSPGRVPLVCDNVHPQNYTVHP